MYDLTYRELKGIIKCRLYGAKSRCTNPRSENYSAYGGRGIVFDMKLYEQVEELITLLLLGAIE